MILSLYFVLWLTLKKLQSVTETKYWHTIVSQLFSFTLKYKLCFKWILSKPSVFTCFVCIWSFGRARSSKCTLLVCFGERRARAHTHTRAQTHTHTRANTHTRTHTRANTHTRTHTHTHFSLRNSISRADCTFNVLLSNMSSNLVTVKTAFYNNRQTIDLILTLSFGQGGTNARRCEEKEVVLEETRL